MDLDPVAAALELSASYVAAGSQIFSGEFVFCRYIRSECVTGTGPSDRLALPQIRKGYQHVVFGAEFEHEFLFDAVA